MTIFFSEAKFLRGTRGKTGSSLQEKAVKPAFFKWPRFAEIFFFFTKSKVETTSERIKGSGFNFFSNVNGGRVAKKWILPAEIFG